MNKKYVERFNEEERAVCQATFQRETGKSEKLRPAMVLLKGDIDGPSWDDVKISGAVGFRTQTVEKVGRAFVLDGFEVVSVRKKRVGSPTPKLRDDGAEAKLLTLRLGKPAAAFSQGTLRILADQMVDLEIVELISPGTVRQMLTKLYH